MAIVLPPAMHWQARIHIHIPYYILHNIKSALDSFIKYVASQQAKHQTKDATAIVLSAFT